MLRPMRSRYIIYELDSDDFYGKLPFGESVYGKEM